MQTHQINMLAKRLGGVGLLIEGIGPPLVAISAIGFIEEKRDDRQH